jgi:C1A family cysteine protease
MASKIIRKYTWKPDPVDHRDKKFSAMHVDAAALPPKVDLAPGCSPIVDQGQQGSCTANASISGAFEYLEIQALKVEGASPVEFDPAVFVRGSRQFNYYCSRAMRGQQGQDSGAYIRDVVKVLNKLGCAREASWPYDPRVMYVQPPTIAYLEAAKHRISDYLRLNNLLEIKQCLANGFPIIFGFPVFSSFESSAVSRSGVVPMPKRGESNLGGHCMCITGYDDASGWVTGRNSWGTGWGNKGYFAMSYDFLQQYGSDFWTLRK